MHIINRWLKRLVGRPRFVDGDARAMVILKLLACGWNTQDYTCDQVMILSCLVYLDILCSTAAD